MTTITKPAPDKVRLVLNAVSTVLGRGEDLEVYATDHGYLAGLPMTQALEVLEAVGLDPWAAPDRLGRGVQRLLRDVYKAPATTTDTVPDTKAAASAPAPTTTQEQPCTSSSHPKRSTRSASSSEPSPSTTPARSRAGSTKTPTHGSATPSRPAGQDHSPSPLEPPSKSSRTGATASAKDATRAPSSPSASPTPSQQVSEKASGEAAPEPSVERSSPSAERPTGAPTDGLLSGGPQQLLQPWQRELLHSFSARDEVHDLPVDDLLEAAAESLAGDPDNAALSDSLSTARRAIVEIEWHVANAAERRRLLAELREISDRATAIEKRLIVLEGPPPADTPDKTATEPVPVFTV